MALLDCGAARNNYINWNYGGQPVLENESIDNIYMDEIYKKMPLTEIPWNNENPPNVLVELVESQKVRPCKTLDMGCGAGNYAIYLAGKGFDVTGVDISPAAIKIAEENAGKKEVTCRFSVVDVTGDLKEIDGTFDFIFDWEMLHHLFPVQRKKYVENVNRKLNAQGQYLSLCFSEKDTQFGGQGKFRKTHIGTQLYFSSEEELRELFEPYFHIVELKTMQVEGKFGSHLANYVFMKK